MKQQLHCCCVIPRPGTSSRISVVRLGWALALPPSSQISLLWFPPMEDSGLDLGSLPACPEPPEPAAHHQICCIPNPFQQLPVFLFPLPTALTHPNPWNFIFSLCVYLLGCVKSLCPHSSCCSHPELRSSCHWNNTWHSACLGLLQGGCSQELFLGETKTSGIISSFCCD